MPTHVGWPYHAICNVEGADKYRSQTVIKNDCTLILTMKQTKTITE